MDQNDQQAISGLFQRLAEAERAAPARDSGAESFIARRVTEQPAAPYYMAQTIVMQQAALEQAQARIEDLESRPQGGGGFLAGLFGGGQPARPAHRAAAQGPASAAMQRQQAMGGGGGGFLAGAAQTAMGVAGGVLLGNAIAGMFAGEAEAAEAPAEEEEPQDEDFDMGEDLEL